MLGVSSMRSLPFLRARYGFRVIRTFPELLAAEVAVTRTLRAGASRERRIRYLSWLGPQRHPTAMPNDPLVSTIDRRIQLPYEWQFSSAHVGQSWS